MQDVSGAGGGGGKKGARKEDLVKASRVEWTSLLFYKLKFIEGKRKEF
jgi:hypothetical protein